MTMRKRITLLPGDGIGPEIVSQAVLVLDKVTSKFGHEFDTISRSAGGCAIDETGDPMPEATVEACRQSDAVLLGAVGGPRWDHLEGHKRPEAGLLRIRRELGLDAGTQFIVVGEDDVVILKMVKAPSMRDFDRLVRKARAQAKFVGLKRSDIASTVAEVRKRRWK